MHRAVKRCTDSDDGVALLEFLVSSSAEVSVPNQLGWLPHHYLGNDEGFADDSPEQLRLAKCYRLFIQRPDWIMTIPTLEGNESLVIPRFERFRLDIKFPLEIVRLALNETWPPWTNRSLPERYETLLPPGSASIAYFNPLCWCICLADRSFPSSFAEWDTDVQRRIAAITMANLGHQLACDQHEWAKETRIMLKEMLNVVDACYLFRRIGRETPMTGFIRSYLQPFFLSERC